MKLTLNIKICPTSEQTSQLRTTLETYIQTVNRIVAQAVEIGEWHRPTSQTVEASLPSAVKNQATQDARSVFRKSKKLGKVPILKKPVCFWNNQNYRMEEYAVSFPLWIGGKSTRILVKALIQDSQRQQLQGHLGTMRIVQKLGKWLVQIPVEVEEAPPKSNTKAMGVDMGIKVPAVVATSTGQTHFFGNGRQQKNVRRHYAAKRKKLGKAKKLGAIRKSKNKEQRWMRDQDHKLSRAIVNLAIREDVSTIRAEKLAGIRSSARKSRKNNRSLHSWSFYRLASFIEYKAKLGGIKVEVVNPAYTSQICPKCGTLNKARDRLYVCECGFRSHRDRVGALNILRVPALSGNRMAA